MKYNLESLKPMIPILIMLSLIIFAAEAYGAGSAFRFGQITALGSGCPEGSVEVIKTENNQTASLLFSEMMVEVPQFNGDNENEDIDEDNRSPTNRYNQFVSHKVCNIIISADIPIGYKITSADISIDYRGATYMDPGTQAMFHSKFLNFVGPQRQEHRVKGTVLRKVWRNGGVEEDWTFVESKRIELNSNCGSRNQRKSQLTLKNIIKAQVKKNYRHTGASAFVSLDSADVVGTMKIKFNTEVCSGRSDLGSDNDHRHDRADDSRQCRRGYIWSAEANSCISKRERSQRGRRSRRPRRPRYSYYR